MFISTIIIIMIIAEQVLTAGEGHVQWEQWVILSYLIYDMPIISKCSSTEQSGLNMMYRINNYDEFIQ